MINVMKYGILSTLESVLFVCLLVSAPPLYGQSNKMHGPLRICKANPRYFTDDSGKAVYLTGAHTWNNLVEMKSSPADGDFDYNADEFYMTDLAGTTTYMVNVNFNIVSIKTTSAAAAIGAPQVVEFNEKTTGKTFMMAITDTGQLEVS